MKMELPAYRCATPRQRRQNLIGVKCSYKRIAIKAKNTRYSSYCSKAKGVEFTRSGGQ